MAAAKIGVPVAQLSVSDGVVTGGGRSVTYGELIGNQLLNTKVTQLSSGSTVDLQVQAKVKDPSTYKVIGKPIPAVPIPNKVTVPGCVSSIWIPGMLHARMVMPLSVVPLVSV